MLDVRANSIIYQSQVALAKITDNLITSAKLSKSKDPIWDKLFKIGEYLTALQYATRSSDTNSQSYILECLIVLTGINSFPSSPVLTLQPIPNILVGAQGATGQTGNTGPKGDTGQATDFLASSLTTTSTVDSFLLSASPGARWDYVVTDILGAQRAGTVEASWSSTGAAIDLYDNAHPDIVGPTTGIEFNVVLSGSSIVLQAVISSGNWTVRGSRYFIPNNGNGSGAVGSVLLNGYTYIGNVGNIATGVLLSGAITVTNTGVTTLSNSVVTNANIVAAAGISLNKIAALTASRIVVSDGSGFLSTVGSPTLTELSYVGGATSNLQAQITAGLVPALTASRPVITNGSGILTANPALSTNRIVKWNGTQFADSLITDDGTTVTIGGTTSITAGNVLLITGGPSLLTKEVAIPNWNMDTTAGISVTITGIAPSRIRSLSFIVFNNAGTTFTHVTGVYLHNTFAGIVPHIGFGGYSTSGSDTLVILRRIDSGDFDNANYNAFNTGKLTVVYTP